MKYLTIEDILIIAVGHVGNYQLLNENQLHYLVDIVGEKFGDTDLFPNDIPKSCCVCPPYHYRAYIFGWK